MSRPALLVLRALGLGDLLTAVPALRGLTEAFPEHELVLATAIELAPLALAAGVVDSVVATSGLSKASPRLMRERPDIAVNLHGRGPQSHALLRALSPRRMIAFAHPDAPGSEDGPPWREGEHEVARWCRLLVESGIPADPSRLDLELSPADPSVGGRGATLLHPGAASPARRWPAERWAAVAASQRRAGRSVVITGSTAEIELTREIAREAGLPEHAVLAGRTTVLELARIVAGAGRVVCGDTGMAHLATALRRPSVVLFGPTPPAWWGPPSNRPWHRALWAGDLGDPHGAQPDRGLLKLHIDDVVQALADLPPAPTAPPARTTRAARAAAAAGAFQGGNDPAPSSATLTAPPRHTEARR